MNYKFIITPNTKFRRILDKDLIEFNSLVTLFHLDGYLSGGELKVNRILMCKNLIDLGQWCCWAIRSDAATWAKKTTIECM